MGRTIFFTQPGASPKREQKSLAYLNSPMSPRLNAQARKSHAFLPRPSAVFSMRRAKNQSKKDMTASSSTYFGSPQA